MVFVCVIYIYFSHFYNVKGTWLHGSDITPNVPGAFLPLMCSNFSDLISICPQSRIANKVEDQLSTLLTKFVSSVDSVIVVHRHNLF